MATKLLENVDDDLWNEFVGYCKIDRIKTGEAITKFLKEFLKNRRKGK